MRFASLKVFFLFATISFFCPPSLIHAAPKNEKICRNTLVNLKGYTILTSTMLVTALATTYLSSQLPKNAQFLGIFVAQISTIGIMVYGAPIWERLFSRLRKNAYGISGDKIEHASADSHVSLERMWKDSQSSFSQNAQMSRNLLNQFIVALRQSLDMTLTSIQKRGEISSYAIDQLAEISIRTRKLYSEIPLDEPSVSLIAQVALANSLTEDLRDELYSKTLDRIRSLDLESSEFAADLYYQKLLRLLLGRALTPGRQI